jgi:curved DNA-binding protein CbpA
LGLRPGSTADEVRRAFRRLAFERHPDRGGSHEAFLELQDAYYHALRLAA